MTYSIAARLLFKRSLTVVMTFGLVACALGPDYQKPNSPLMPATSFIRESSLEVGSATQVSPAAVPKKWWMTYGSERINALVDQALQHNPNISVGLANLQNAQENVVAQQGFFYPSVQAAYTGSRQSIGSTLASPLASGASPYNLHTAQLSVGFVPDVFGGNKREVESLQATAQSQLYQLEALRITIASNVVAAAIQENALVVQLKIAQDAGKAAQEQLEHLKKQLAVGYVGGLEVAQQEVAYAQTLSVMPPLKRQLEQTRDLLAILCGQLPSEALPTGSEREIQIPAALPLIVPSQLAQYRPDIQAAQEQLHAAFAQIGVAVGNMYPQISIGANLGYNSSVLPGLLNPANQAWGVLAGLTLPVFEGGTLSARKRAAEAAAGAARAQYQSVVLTAFQNVADTLYAIDQDGRALSTAEHLEMSMKHQLDLTQNQFDQGYSSLLVLLNARQSYLQAKLAKEQSKSVYLGDTTALFQALGGGWQPNSNP